MGLIDEGKSILSLVNKAANRELYERLMEYLDRVFELQGERAKLQEDLQKAGAEIKNLEGSLAFSKKLVVGYNSYWTEDGDGPFCFGCWDGHKRVSRLKTHPMHLGWKDCPVCKATYSEVGKVEKK